MASRAERRRATYKTRDENSMIVCIPNPETFLDCMDEPWQAQKGGSLVQIDFAEVLIHTIRRMPAKDCEDSERALSIIGVLKAAEESFGMQRSDYDWLQARLREHGHKIWPPPDSVLIRRHLDHALRNGAKDA